MTLRLRELSEDERVAVQRIARSHTLGEVDPVSETEGVAG
jgi:hypothetical protein